MMRRGLLTINAICETLIVTTSPVSARETSLRYIAEDTTLREKLVLRYHSFTANNFGTAYRFSLIWCKYDATVFVYLNLRH